MNPMILDPQTISPGAMYRFMIGVIVPRPIAFVSTRDANGHLNLAPFSYFTPLTNRPPLVGFSVQSREGEPKDTARNIEATGEFVINIVSEPMAEGMVLASGEWPPHVDEFELAGFTPAPSERVAPPRVAESPVSLECRLHQIVELGAARFVVGEVVLAHVADGVLDAHGHVDPARLAPLGRLGGDAYAPLRDIVRIARPVVERDAERDANR
jgi:flavin reductase (DIM6/NTAB) family NADH-FMN oxidoreductase RutF